MEVGYEFTKKYGCDIKSAPKVLGRKFDRQNLTFEVGRYQLGKQDFIPT